MLVWATKQKCKKCVWTAQACTDCMSDLPENCIFCVISVVFSRSRFLSLLVTFWVSVWELLGDFWDRLGLFGPSWATPGHSWVSLGGSLGPLGASLGALLGGLGRTLKYLMDLWAPLGGQGVPKGAFLSHFGKVFDQMLGRFLSYACLCL